MTDRAALLMLAFLAGLLFHLHGTVVELQNEVAKVKVGTESRLEALEAK